MGFFDSGEEVFDMITMPIVTAMEPGRMVASFSRRDAASETLRAQAGAE